MKVAIINICGYIIGFVLGFFIPLLIDYLMSKVDLKGKEIRKGKHND